MSRLGVGCGIGMGSRPFVLTDLAGCVLAFDGDTGSRANAAHLTSGNVDTFADYSGLAHDVGAVAGKRPLWTPSGTGGYAAFDGAAHVMRADFVLSHPSHVFLAVCPTYAGTGNKYLFDGGVSYSGALVDFGGSGSLTMYAGGAAPSKAYTSGAWQILDAYYSGGAGSTLGIDGGAVATGNAGGTQPNGFVVGALGAGTANFTQELVAGGAVYNRQLPEAERQMVIWNLIRMCAKLNIAIAHA